MSKRVREKHFHILSFCSLLFQTKSRLKNNTEKLGHCFFILLYHCSGYNFVSLALTFSIIICYRCKFGYHMYMSHSVIKLPLLTEVESFQRYIIAYT